ncbi:hypothetical protein [Enterobacter soli]|uniref:hypothetical protein n=1 Tax=Enterobacter soli TaxID=885040 RepID=UPI003F86CE7D
MSKLPSYYKIRCIEGSRQYRLPATAVLREVHTERDYLRQQDIRKKVSAALTS